MATIPVAMASAVTSTIPHCSGKTAGRRGAKVLRRRRRHTRETVSVEEAFGVVIFVVVIVAGIVAVVTLFGRSRSEERRVGKECSSTARPGSWREAGGCGS